MFSNRLESDKVKKLLNLLRGDSESTEIKVDIDELTYEKEISANNQSTDIVRYKGELFTGTAIEKYDNGTIHIETNYTNGKENGLKKLWYKNGQMKFELNYKDGRQDGKQRWWNENGQLLELFHYHEGKRHGLTKRWGANGQLVYTDHYQHGVRMP